MRDLKNSECPERCPGGFMEAERTEMLLRWGGAGRAFAGLKIGGCRICVELPVSARRGVI